MIVGGIDEDPSISQYVSSSTSYNQDELTWCVAKAQRKHSFFNFLAGFNATAWLLLLLFILTSSLAVLAAQRVSGFKIYRLHRYLSICLNILGILVTQAINVNAQSWPIVLRMLFGLAFFMAFFFSNTYQSFLISTLTNPTTQDQISRLEEIYGNRMLIMISSEHVRHLDKEGEVSRTEIIPSLPYPTSLRSPLRSSDTFERSSKSATTLSSASTRLQVTNALRWPCPGNTLSTTPAFSVTDCSASIARSRCMCTR